MVLAVSTAVCGRVQGSSTEANTLGQGVGIGWVDGA